MTSWSWMVQRNRSMNTALSLGCRVLGLTLPTAGLHNTLRPVHLQAWWGCVLPTCAQGLVEQRSRWLGEGKINGPPFGGLVLLLSIFVFYLLVNTWIRNGRGGREGGGSIVTVIGVHTTWRCTSPRGVVSVGSGNGVDDCHDTAALRGEGLFYVHETVLFLRGTVCYFYALLSMLVAQWEPTPCYRDAHSVGALKWAYWEKVWQNHCETTVPPCLDVFFWLAKGPFFSGRWFSGCSKLAELVILDLARRHCTLVSCRLSLSMSVGG